MAQRRIKINNFGILPYEICNVIIENVTSAIFVFDKNGKLIAVNRKSRELFDHDYQKISLEELFSTVKALKPNKSPFPLEETPLYCTLKSGQEVRNVEMTIQRPDSERFPVSVCSIPVFDENKNIVAVIGVFEEITEHNKVEKTLRESEKRFRAVAQAANVLVYEIFLKECSVAVFTGEEVLGYKKGELPTTLDWWLRQIHPDDRKTTKQKLRKAINRGRMLF
jgi:PAS domain S-box-containing protein